MKLLEENSVLKNLPQIQFEQFLILDAIRFTIEIIEINYNELIEELEAMSYVKRKNMAKTFNCVWNIVDNFQRLSLIYKKIPQEQELTLFKESENIKFFRHSYQHLEDRIKEIIIDKRLPVFGALKWIVNDSEKPFSCLAVSGNFYQGNEMEVTVAGVFPNEPLILQIILMTTVKQNNVTFEKELSISDLMANLADNVAKLEQGLKKSIEEKQLVLMDRKSVKDILMIFKNESF